MIQTNLSLDVNDNTGARSILCIKVLGGSKRRYAGIGDRILAKVEQVLPRGRRTYSEVYSLAAAPLATTGHSKLLKQSLAAGGFFSGFFIKTLLRLIIRYRLRMVHLNVSTRLPTTPTHSNRIALNSYRLLLGQSRACNQIIFNEDLPMAMLILLPNTPMYEPMCKLDTTTQGRFCGDSGAFENCLNSLCVTNCVDCNDVEDDPVDTIFSSAITGAVIHDLLSNNRALDESVPIPAHIWNIAIKLCEKNRVSSEGINKVLENESLPNHVFSASANIAPDRLSRAMASPVHDRLYWNDVAAAQRRADLTPEVPVAIVNCNPKLLEAKTPKSDG